MTDLLHDLRHALRTLRAYPGFTAASVAPLALAIGANATILSGVSCWRWGGFAGVLLSAWGLDLLNALRPQTLVVAGGPGGARLN